MLCNCEADFCLWIEAGSLEEVWMLVFASAHVLFHAECDPAVAQHQISEGSSSLRSCRSSLAEDHFNVLAPVKGTAMRDHSASCAAEQVQLDMRG